MITFNNPNQNSILYIIIISYFFKEFLKIINFAILIRFICADLYNLNKISKYTIKRNKIIKGKLNKKWNDWIESASIHLNIWHSVTQKLYWHTEGVFFCNDGTSWRLLWPVFLSVGKWAIKNRSHNLSLKNIYDL